IDVAAQKLHLVDPAGATVLGSASLSHKPLELVVAQGGQWAFVTETDGADGFFIQSVDLAGLELGRPDIVGAAYEIGKEPGVPAVDSLLGRLYLPYAEDMAVDDAGAVAVFDITQLDCAGLLQGEDCPACE